MKRFILEFATEGQNEIINLNAQVTEHLRGVQGDGVVHLFAMGSTAALTTMEFEPGLVKHDFKAVMQKLIPDDDRYEHEATWNDDNGHSHVRASMIGPSVTIPFANGKPLMGEYQQVVFIDFDTGPRRRRVIGTIIV